jgi:hypothetical protein
MKLHEIDPEKRYVLAIEADDVSQQDLETWQEKFRERGLENITIVTGPLAPDVPRYWGIWVSPPNGKPDWVSRSGGDLLYYPSPVIAAVHMKDLGWEYCSVREFVFDGVLQDVGDYFSTPSQSDRPNPAT